VTQDKHVHMCSNIHVTFYVTNEPPPWSRMLFEELVFPQLVQNSKNFTEPSSSFLCHQVPALCHCLGRFKELLVIRGPVKHYVTRGFPQWWVVSSRPNYKTGVPHLVGCHRMFILQYAAW